MQRPGTHDDRVFLLPDARGHHLRLRFDSDVPPDMSVLDRVLTTERTDTWSGVTIEHGVSFAELAAERKGWFPFGAVRGGSFAFLVARPALDGAGIEFGARAYGVHGEDAATALVEQIQAWDRHARRGPAPPFAY